MQAAPCCGPNTRCAPAVGRRHRGPATRPRATSCRRTGTPPRSASSGRAWPSRRRPTCARASSRGAACSIVIAAAPRRPSTRRWRWRATPTSGSRSRCAARCSSSSSVATRLRQTALPPRRRSRRPKRWVSQPVSSSPRSWATPPSSTATRGGAPGTDAVAHDAAARGGHVPQQVRAVGGLGDLLRLANARRAYENCLVAKAGGGAVGTAHAFKAEPTDPGLLSEADPVLAPSAALEAPGALHLSGPAVRERWRGRSLGSAVLAGAPSGVSLICSEKNGRARAFYERRGFYVVARRAVVPHPLLSVGGGALLMVREALGGRGDRSRPRVGLGRTMPVPGALRGGWRPLGPGWPGADARARRSAPPQRCGRPRTTREMS